MGYNEEDANKLLRKMVGALAYMHANGLVHRDLKLENFIFTDKSIEKQIKLIDFGFSRAYLEGDTMSAFVGTSYYIAPEVPAGVGASVAHGPVNGRDENNAPGACGIRNRTREETRHFGARLKRKSI